VTRTSPLLNRAPATRLLVPLFLLSGAASLVYEVLWARQLHVVFGTSQLAITTVLAAFMAGLALGSFGAARWAGRTTRPLLAYAVLEGFIGLYAVAFPWILRLATPVYLGFWQVVEPGPAAFGAFQFVLVGILLLPPTICMGAALPLLSRFVIQDRAETGYQVGRLYGVNTLGAVLGTGLAGFVLLPQLGLAAATWATAIANWILALAAAGLSRVSEPIPSVGEVSAGTKPARTRPASKRSAKERDAGEPEPEWPLRPLLFVAAMAGFASLLCEVAWFRLLVLLLGGSTYAFTIMLLAFLLGIGVGGWVGGRSADATLRRGGRRLLLRRLAWIQIGVGVFSWVAMLLYGQLPFAYVWLYGAVEGAGALLWRTQLLLALAIMIVPTLLMGATFPYLVRAAAGSADEVSRPVGRIYGANTIGALAGAALGGLLLLPTLNIQGTVLTGVAINIAAALVAGGAATAVAGRVRGVGFVVSMAAAAIAILLVFTFRPPWDPILMASGMYRYVDVLEDRSRQGLIDFAVTPYDLLYYDEGVSSVVTVAENTVTGNIWLSNNGKIDASSQGDVVTQVLSAQLPMLLRPDAEKVLVIGLASGISLGSVTLHEQATVIDIVEIEPSVITASHYFDEYNKQPLADPRVRVHVNDARNHLLLAPDGTYDVVSSEPSNPWLSGVSNLFTLEFFELGKRKMAPDGVWSQWIQTYALTPDDVRSLLATFAAVFDHVRLFRVDSSDLIVLGSGAPLPLSAEGIVRAANRSRLVAADLASIGFTRGEDLLGLYMFDRARLLEMAGDAELNTDDNMLIEYSAPRHLYADTEGANSVMLIDAAEIPTGAVEGTAGLKNLAEAYDQHDWDLRRAIVTLHIARELDPDDPEIDSMLEDLLD